MPPIAFSSIKVSQKCVGARGSTPDPTRELKRSPDSLADFQGREGERGWKRKEGVRKGDRREGGKEREREGRTTTRRTDGGERERRRGGEGRGKEREGELILPTMKSWIRHWVCRLQTNKFTHSLTHSQTYKHTNIRTCVVRTYVGTYVRTYLPTYIRTYIHTLNFMYWYGYVSCAMHFSHPKFSVPPGGQASEQEDRGRMGIGLYKKERKGRKNGIRTGEWKGKRKESEWPGRQERSETFPSPNLVRAYIQEGHKI